ncbi:MAG: methyltransferase domain-containing protein [Desulfuromonadales bacterium]|nr:methyltransferase domain-containing protein [Desulfuromonadales bacterium]MDW7758560.1 methyltransferase domain-containing protein [Desulfuromonadales bacterium]
MLRKNALCWQPEQTTDLHEERLNKVVQTLLARNVLSVLDLGCGPGELLVRLAGEMQFRTIAGIDSSQEALAKARARLSFHDEGLTDRKMSLYLASYTSLGENFCGFDAAVMIETIEHVAPQRLSAVEQAVFVGCRPRTVIITTPNREYNVLHGISDDVFRHPDHRFEWTREKFRRWADGVARRNGYQVVFEDIGAFDPRHGSSTQMATFSLTQN